MTIRGFSIMELVLAIAILGLLGLFSLPLINNYQQKTQLEQQARALAIDLRYTQQQAIAQQKNFALTLDTETNSYTISNVADDILIRQVQLHPHISFSTITGLTNNTVVFNQGGGVAETGIIVLTNTQSTDTAIEIKPSGYVTIND